jgi:serine/threonine protein kinase
MLLDGYRSWNRISRGEISWILDQIVAESVGGTQWSRLSKQDFADFRDEFSRDSRLAIGHVPHRGSTRRGRHGRGVSRARHETQSAVAIKFLSDDLADSDARRRFQREAQMASSLNHPHILTVYDAGEFEGRQYLVTEFVDGDTLKSWARSGKRTWRQIVELLVGVADGLAAAHQAGILHRDIKPENILVAKNGYAKLADFGLSKLTEAIQDTLRR